MSIALRGRLLVWTCSVLLVANLAQAQIQLPTESQLAAFQGVSAKDDAPISVKAVFAEANGPTPARLYITAEIKKDWHIYSLTQPKGGPLPSKIKLPESPHYKVAGQFKSSPQPTVHLYPEAYGDLPVEEHQGRVTFYAPLEIAKGVDARNLKIDGKLNVQACNADNCLPPQDYPFAAQLGQPPKLEPENDKQSAVPRQDDSPINASLGEYKNPRSHSTIRGSIEPQTAAPGDTVRLTLSAEPADQWHVYALADKAEAVGSKPTLIVFTETSGFTPSTPKASSQPVRKPADGPVGFEQVYHEGPVSWTVQFKLPADAAHGEHSIRGLMGFQTCWAKNCDLPQATEFSTTLTVAAVAKPGEKPLAFTDAKYGEAAKLAAARSPQATDEGAIAASYRSPTTATGAASPGTNKADPTLIGTLFLGFMGGMLLNLMPCVFPVIGLKVLSFVEQGGHSRRQAFILNLWYSLGLLAVFLALATLAVVVGVGWGGQFQNAGFTVTLTCIVFVFALSFLGVWEIPIPGFVGSGKANDLAAQEGGIGAFMKGVLTTVLATPCTGPFMGPALSWSVAQPPTVTYSVFAAVGLGMATPYLVIGVFPSLLRFLPRPGMWMETFKQVMGFVLLGTVVWLLTSVPWIYVVPCVAMLMALWAACWWIGRTPLTSGMGDKLRAWGWATAFSGAIGLFAFNWLAGYMEHQFERKLDAVIAARAETAGPESGDELTALLRERQHKLSTTPPDELPWQAFTSKRLKLLTDNNYTVLVDFTAQWCPTCKVNEAVAFNTQETRQFMDANEIVPLVADMTEQFPAAEELLVQLGNASTAIPYAVIFPAGQADKPIMLDGPLLKNQVIAALQQAGPSKTAASTSTTAMLGQ